MTALWVPIVISIVGAGAIAILLAFLTWKQECQRKLQLLEDMLSQHQRALVRCRTDLGDYSRNLHESCIQLTRRLSDCEATFGTKHRRLEHQLDEQRIHLDEQRIQRATYRDDLVSIQNLVTLLFDQVKWDARMHKAASENDKEFIINARSGFFGGKIIPWSGTECGAAASGGHYELVKWLVGEGCPLGSQLGCPLRSLLGGWPFNFQPIYFALRTGNLEMIDWMLSNMTDEERTQYKNSEGMCDKNLLKNMQALKLLFEHPKGLVEFGLDRLAVILSQTSISDECFQYLLSKTGKSTITEQGFIRLIQILSDDNALKYLPHFSGRVEGGLTAQIDGHACLNYRPKVRAWLRAPAKPGGACPG